ncbi:hypothetical protein N2152v2_001155 [Parachlorella kessleri]
MDTVKGWLSRGNEPPASVLAEWNKYSGGSGASQTDRLLSSAEEGATAVTSFLGSSFKVVSTGVTGAASSVGAGVQSLAVPSGTQMTYFAFMLGSGVVFLLLAFFLFLPVAILSPSKFALTFSLGSALVLASLGALRGWKQQLRHMTSKERLPFTGVYLGSLIGTLYAALFMHSYLLSLLCCIIQVPALIYYCLSYFPGGAAGTQFVLTMVGRLFGQAFGACTRMFIK